MKYYLSLLCMVYLTTCTAAASAQNLIENGGFEEMSSPPNDISQFERVRNWNNISGTPDLMSEQGIFNIPTPFGDAYAGLGFWEREFDYEFYTEAFIQRLKKPIEAGKQYYVQGHTAMANFSSGACVSLEIYGGTKPVNFIDGVDSHISEADGVVLLGKTEVVSSVDEFKPFEFCFSPDTTVKHVIVSVGKGICDHYLYFDQFQIYELEETKLFAEEEVLCNAQTIRLGVNIKDAKYRWQDGSTEAFYEVSEPGTYWVSIDTVCQLELRDSIEILDGRIDLPTDFLGRDTMLCQDEPLELNVPAPLNAPYEYVWQTGEKEQSIDVDETGLYRVYVRRLGCEESDVTNVTFEFCKPCEMYIPTAFSPNNDGQNDYFEVFPSCPIVEYELSIFDRWGQIVFETNDVTAAWDGVNPNDLSLSQGVYTYLIRYTGEQFGELVENEVIGDIMVVE